MASTSTQPKLERVIKSVSKAFSARGWIVDRQNSEDCDLLAVLPTLRILIKCMDDVAISFRSNSAIVSQIEKTDQDIRSKFSRTRVVVLDRNFLSIPLDTLLDRNLIVITLDQISEISSISRFQEELPDNLTRRERLILERDCDFAVNSSSRYMATGEKAQAITWAEHAIRARQGLSPAYPHFLNLLKKYGDLDRAEFVAREMLRFRPDHPQAIMDMISVAQLRGDKTTASKFKERLADDTRTPRTLSDILQRQKETRDAAEKGTAPSGSSLNSGVICEPAQVSKSAFGWFRRFISRE